MTVIIIHLGGKRLILQNIWIAGALVALIAFAQGSLAFAQESKQSVVPTKNGLARQYYDSGELMAEVNYKNFKLEGKAVEYYTNGKVKSERIFKNNTAHGPYKTFYQNGGLWAIGNYEQGKKVGITKGYYKTGELQGEWPYNKDGKREGVAKLYYKDGPLLAEDNYKDDKIDGVCKGYYDTGELFYTETYKDGFRLERKEYGKEGTLLTEKKF